MSVSTTQSEFQTSHLSDQPPAAALEEIAKRTPQDLENALGVLEERISHQFQVTERLEAKSRQNFTLAAGFFAAAQASAFAIFGADAVTSAERFVVLATALATAVSLAVVAVRLYRGEQLRKEESINPAIVYEWCRDLEPPNLVSAHLIWALSGIAEARIASNRTREAHTQGVLAAAGVTLALASVELVVAMVARI
jgi:hypothetical protein